jgi:hypothetical protein
MLDLREVPEGYYGGSGRSTLEHRVQTDHASARALSGPDQRIADEIRTVMAMRGLIQHANHMLAYVDKKLMDVSSPQLCTEIRAELAQWLRAYMR